MSPAEAYQHANHKHAKEKPYIPTLKPCQCCCADRLRLLLPVRHGQSGVPCGLLPGCAQAVHMHQADQQTKLIAGNSMVCEYS